MYNIQTQRKVDSFMIHENIPQILKDIEARILTVRDSL